jgi:hypothetical protein
MAEESLQVCKVCLVSKKLSEYYAHPRTKSGVEGTCKDCRRQLSKTISPEAKEARLLRNKKWAQDNAEKVKEISRRTTLRMYSLTPESYEKQLAAQGGACKGCGLIPPKRINLHVDHDHGCCPGNRSCGRCIRGLLCMKCNTILGKAGDNPEILRALARYLEGGEI